jgi:hypothetical protein
MRRALLASINRSMVQRALSYLLTKTWKKVQKSSKNFEKSDKDPLAENQPFKTENRYIPAKKSSKTSNCQC